MARPRQPKGLTRPIRIQVSLDVQLDEDLGRIAEGWQLPPASVAYWLLRGLMADLRGESVAMVGEPMSERAGRWMAARFPGSTENED